ncbi:MAG TPA: hypothetical protein VHZ95_17010 [Polyangiales bacterium]|jgi:hypothetical protein|nr:hypothetical protein [Polyangiales bacterium]
MLNIESVLCRLPLCLALFAGTALAQNPELGDTGRDHTPPPAVVRVEETHAPARHLIEVATSGTDHSMMVGHFGVGFFGVLSLPTMGCTGGTPTGGTCAPDIGATLSAPTIGARYWLDERMAIEGALGIGATSGSVTVENGGTSTDSHTPHFFGLALHAGLPLVFATSAHFSFEVVPEMNVGFVSGGWTANGNGNNSADLSGFLLELGGRVGAEIQFGFIGIPQLALQGTVGVHLRYEGRSVSVGDSSTSSHNFSFGTSVDGKPWDIFNGNIAAIYYF